MAKQTNTDLAAASDAAAIENQLPYSEKLALMAFVEEQDEKALKELTGGEYITLEKNKKYVFLAVGITRKPSDFSKDEDGCSNVAVLLDKTGKKLFCSQAVLVRTVEQIDEQELLQGVHLVVITEDEVKGDKGKYLAMRIFRS